MELASFTASYKIADTQLEILIGEYKKKADEKKKIEKELADIKDQIQMQMCDYTEIMGSQGDILATWNWSKPVVRFDTKKFKEEMPLIYGQYAVESEPVRSFLVK